MPKYSSPRKHKTRGRVWPNWYTRVYRDDGKVTWLSLETTDLVEATEKVQELIRSTPGAELAGRKRPLLVPGKVGNRLGAVLDAWHGSKKLAGNAKSSLRVQRYVIETWKRHLGPNTPIEEITTLDLERLLGKIEDAGAGGRTLNNHRAWLRSFFTWAGQRRLAGRNPALVLPKHREKKRHLTVLGRAQQGIFLERADKRGVGLWAALQLLAGFRRGTAEALTWRDVDLEQGVWRIPAAKLKNRQDYQAPVAPALLERLRRARGVATIGDKIVAPCKPATWAAVCREAGVVDLRPHDLRRTFVTTLRKSGVALEVAMSLSDHRDLRTVIECYRLVDCDEQAEALGQAFGQEG